MKRVLARCLTATVVAAVGLGAAALSSTASPVNAAAAKAAPTVQRIDFTSSGGITGQTTHVVVRGSNAKPAAVRARALARGGEFRKLAPSYRPEGLCCDLIAYDLTVSYSDGTVKTVLVWDAAKTPQVLRDVISLTRKSGVRAPVQTAPHAQEIVVVRSGGFAGRTTTFTIDREHSSNDATEALALASGAEYRALKAQYPADDPCCDRFEYQVTVSYPDGWSKTVTTSDAAEAPQVLWKVISLAVQQGQNAK